MSRDPLLHLLDRHLTAENAHDLEGTLATLVDDCEFVDHALQVRWTGHQGAAAHYTMWWQAFDLVVTGDRAIDVRDGLMAGERFYWDRGSLAHQLGVADLGPVAGATAMLQGATP